MHIEQNVILAPFTTFGIGGPADFFVHAQSKHDVTHAIAFAQERKIPFFLLGTGANILVSDKGFRGLVIRNESAQFHITDNTLIAEAGAKISDLIAETAAQGLSGLEHFAGIPSTVGGALWQNLHFLSPNRKTTVYIGDILQEAELLQIINHKSQITKVHTDYFHFGYDQSVLHHTDDIVLSATFRLTPEDPQVIQERINANLAWRSEKHPYEAWKVSAGSVFKKLEGYGAGRLIEQVGLKGKQIGGAQISLTHANFIVNTGNATAQDVQELIALVQSRVKEKLGLQLEIEISLVGDF